MTEDYRVPGLERRIKELENRGTASGCFMFFLMIGSAVSVYFFPKQTIIPFFDGLCAHLLYCR